MSEYESAYNESCQRSMHPDGHRFRMPAEWERQQAVWISFPHNRATWSKNLADAQAEMQYLVHLLSESQCVRINVPTGYQRYLESQFARELVGGRVILHDIPTDDAWCRDHGAVFVRASARDLVVGFQSDGRGPDDSSKKRTAKLTAVNWGYNAWGGKYPPFDQDNAAATKMAVALGVDCFDGGMILEGGAIDVNGSGSLLATESCLLSQTRNPQLSRTQIEERLHEALGAEEVLWLSGGDVVGDDTDGHIDNLARFVAEDVVVYAVSDDSGDANHEVLRKLAEQLRVIAADKNWRLVGLPTPNPVTYDGVQLPASYANFLITNEMVLVPGYGGIDERARAILRELFPSRQVELIPTSNLLVGLGSIHCLTQQVPDFEHWSNSD